MMNDKAVEASGDGNVVVVVNNNVGQSSRGAGTVLMFVFFGWLLPFWWGVLLQAWLAWLIVAAVVTIFNHEFFGRTWYYPWPAWLFGIR
jgi:hypothetical protein